MSEEVKSGVKPVVLGGILAAVIGLIVLLFLPKAAPVSDVTTALADDEAPAVMPDPVEAAPAPEVAVEAPAMPTTPPGPQFDTFRVETDGSMVIAGRAEPDQIIDIILGGETLERVTADGSGSFVALPTAGPSDQPRRLSLVADPDGAAIPSETSYIVAPIAAPVVVAEASPDAPQPAAPVAPAAPEPVIVAPELAAPTPPEETIVADAPPVIAPPPAPPVVLQADTDGIRIAQGAAIEETPNVALDTITYDPEGEVQLYGRASGDGAVQVYIDNTPLTTSPVTEGGDWRVDLPDIDTGVYTLRIDEVDGAGDVVSRIETPFKREEPEDVAAVLAEETSAEGFEVAVKTVQPGATLWAIAEENLGDGILYVEVFTANSDLIRDPDLIYPGQIFRIPDITE